MRRKPKGDILKIRRLAEFGQSAYDARIMVVNIPALITLIILTVAVILLLFNVTRPDLIALLVLISLGLTSVITPADLFSGFSRSAVITVMALFIMTNALYRTRVTR
jgi:uncharacterized membrane protein